MKHKIKIRRGAAWLGGLFLILALAPLKGIVTPTDDHPKLEQKLMSLMNTALRDGPEAAASLAFQQGIATREGRVRVVAVLKRGGSEILLEQRKLQLSAGLEAMNGHVETAHGRLVQALVPPEELAALADLPEVLRIRLPFEPVPLETSEGVAVTGAHRWQELAAYRGGGGGVRVCVLDAGFEGYEALLGTELPGTVTVRSFRADGELFNSPHGTACAEIVHDMAPNADLYLVNFSTDVEHQNAVDWIISQQVDVISYSMGWLCAGAGDGTGPICEAVEMAHQAGLVWVSAAGNSAERHWQAKFRDVDDDDWCDFKAAGAEKDYFAFYADKDERYQVWLNWDDWGDWDGSDYVNAEGQDYDLYLYDKDFKLIASSTNRQTNGFYPVEAVSAKARSRGWRYLRVKKRNADRDCRLEMFFVDAHDLEHVQPYGSLTVPADAVHALAVGAVDWWNDVYHAYSSRGPTSDGRVKPDLCSPSGVTTVTYGGESFYGTSASTPHVAGAVALLKAHTLYSLQEILVILRGRALDLGAAGQDNAYGHGRLKLDR